MDYLLATVPWLSIDPSTAQAAVGQAADQIAACVSPDAGTVSAAPIRPPLAEQAVSATFVPRGRGALKFVLFAGTIALLMAGAIWIDQFVSRNSQSPPSGGTEGVPPSPPVLPPTPIPSASTALVEQQAVSPSASALATAAAIIPMDQSPSDAVASSPQNIVRRYFDCFAEREPTAAYNLLSSSFRANLTFRKYSAMFSSTREINLLDENVLHENESNAAVLVQFEEIDADSHKAYWQGPIDLVRESGEWRIDTLRELKKIPAPDGAALRPKLTVATSPPPRLPEKSWDRPHVYLELADQSQMKAAGKLRRLLQQAGCVVVEVETVSWERRYSVGNFRDSLFHAW